MVSVSAAETPVLQSRAMRSFQLLIEDKLVPSFRSHSAAVERSRQHHQATIEAALREGLQRFSPYSSASLARINPLLRKAANDMVGKLSAMGETTNGGESEADFDLREIVDQFLRKLTLEETRVVRSAKREILRHARWGGSNPDLVFRGYLCNTVIALSRENNGQPQIITAESFARGGLTERASDPTAL